MSTWKSAQMTALLVAAALWPTAATAQLTNGDFESCSPSPPCLDDWTANDEVAAVERAVDKHGRAGTDIEKGLAMRHWGVSDAAIRAKATVEAS